jgi:hypothetical protein
VAARRRGTRDAEAAAAKLHEDEMAPARLKPEARWSRASVTYAAGDLDAGGRRAVVPDDLPPDYNPALVPPVKGAGRGKGSRRR